MSITLHTLGRLAVFVDGEEYPALISQKLRCALLLYLAVEGQATRDTILALLWPDREAEKARHALSQTLYELRQAFGSEWLESHGERLRVTDAVTADAREFEEAAEAGELERAAGLYEGPFLEGVHLAASSTFESWVDRKRAQLRRSHRVVRRQLVEERLPEGRLTDALAVARRWVALEPLDDEAQHRLIELLARSGQRSEALRQFERFRDVLEEDDLEPLDDTRKLVEEIREGGSEEVAAGPGRSGEEGAGERPGDGGAVATGPDDRVRERAVPYGGGGGGRVEKHPGEGPAWRSPFSGDDPPFDFMRRLIWLLPIGYASAAFVILELANMLFPAFGLSQEAFRLTALAILLGFPVAIALAWALEPGLWPRGLRERWERGERSGPGGLVSWRAMPSLVAIVFAAGVMGLIWIRWPGMMSEAAGADAAATAVRPEDRLAVLYFGALDPQDQEATTLAAGLTESLIDELHSVPEFDVISRAGVRPFRDREVPHDSIGRMLNVGLLVDGTVATFEDSVRVSVEIIRAATGEAVTTRTLSRPRQQILPLLNDLLSEITRFLRPTLGEEVRRRFLREGTENPEAWRLVQEGVRYGDDWLSLFESGNVQAVSQRLERAEASFLQAISLDPEWPEPRIRLGWLLVDQARVARFRSDGGWDVQTLLDRAEDQAEELLARDSTSARALELRGGVAHRRAILLAEDPEQARTFQDTALRYYGDAVGIDGTLATAWRGIADIQYTRGEFASARAAAQRAHREDPYLQGADANLRRLAMSAFELGLEGEALQWCESGLERADANPDVLPVFLDCVLTVMAWGDSVPPDPDRAARAVGRLRAMARPDVEASARASFLYLQAGILARAGRPDTARVVLDEARNAARDPEGLLWLEAAVLARLGEKDRALDVLERYAQAKPQHATVMLRRRACDPLRDDPRFPTLLGRLD